MGILCELEKLEQEYREVKNQLEILRKSLGEIAIENMDKYLLRCDNEID